YVFAEIEARVGYVCRIGQRPIPAYHQSAVFESAAQLSVRMRDILARSVIPFHYPRLDIDALSAEGRSGSDDRTGHPCVLTRKNRFRLIVINIVRIVGRSRSQRSGTAIQIIERFDD